VRMYLKQVWIRETNVSKPSITRRNAVTVVKTGGAEYSRDKLAKKPDYCASSDRRRGGVNLIPALVWNCGNQAFRCKGKSTSGSHHEAKRPKRNTGTDRPVRAKRTGNAVGAKGTDQAVAFHIQPETGGNV
jgi:hypothetical protein